MSKKRLIRLPILAFKVGQLFHPSSEWTRVRNPGILATRRRDLNSDGMCDVLIFYVGLRKAKKTRRRCEASTRGTMLLDWGKALAVATEPVRIPETIKFGKDFELDLRAYELRRSGRALKLEPTPMAILLLLAEQRGMLVTREQIVERVWGKGVFLDTDNSINGAIRKIRQVLKDDPEGPQFIQTVTGKGYRFIAPVTNRRPAEPVLIQPRPHETDSRKLHRRPWQVAIALAILLLLGAVHLRSLRSVSRHPVVGGRQLLAVLPFANLTGDPGQEYFSDGLTEEMITALGRVDPEQLGVIARTSVMRYKKSPATLNQIGQDLEVQFVLEGSVRRSADRVRVTAQLIQVKDQTHLWAQEYDRELKDLLVLQAEIAGRIAEEIQPRLGNKLTQPVKHPSSSPQNYEAYDLYLQGEYFWNKRNAEGFQRAIEYFKAAISKDPNYARAYAGMADCYALMADYSGFPNPEFARQARAAAVRALEMDPLLPEGHTALALVVELYDWNWRRAEEEYRRAIELNPNYSTAHHWYAEHLAWRGRFDEALRESDFARQLDPLSLIIATDRAAILYYARQYDRAIEQFQYVRDRDPRFPRSEMIAMAYAQKGMFTEALKLTEKYAVGSPWDWSQLGYIYGRAGRQADARRAQQNLLLLNRRQHVDLVSLAISCISVRDHEQALMFLDKASTQEPNALMTLKVDPIYDPLRGDPRFQALLQRAGLAE